MTETVFKLKNVNKKFGNYYIFMNLDHFQKKELKKELI